MAWFKTDDKLPDHRKARAVRKSHPDKRRDAAPFGLWALAGAWSSDGFVPLEILEDWDDNALELADRLVAAGMWHPTQREGEPGYMFHDWHDHNPARDDNDPSSTGTFGNHVRWHVQRKLVDPNCAHCPTEPDASADIGPIVGATSGGIAPNRSRPDPVPDPTRPDPSPSRAATPSLAAERLERFDEFWETYCHKVDRKKAETAYIAALKKPGVTDDLLIAAAAAYITWQMSEGKHPEVHQAPDDLAPRRALARRAAGATCATDQRAGPSRVGARARGARQRGRPADRRCVVNPDRGSEPPDHRRRLR